MAIYRLGTIFEGKTGLNGSGLAWPRYVEREC